ncbi:MAG: hypothetical protein ACK50L_03590 [Bacteroidota bacterium]|jgi:hypothetical protein
MYKTWNKTGKLKALILSIIFLLNLFVAVDVPLQLDFLPILMQFLFACLSVLLLAKIGKRFMNLEIAKPDWNDNILFNKRILSIFQFGAFFFVTCGLSFILGTGIKFQSLNYLGLVCIAFGLGILGGITLTLKLTKLNV